MNCNAFDYVDYYNGIGGGNGKRKNYNWENCESANSKLFSKIQGTYVLKKPYESLFLPEFVNIEGKICRKYLNIFFLNTTLSQLTHSQVVSICDIRLKNINAVISIEYNKYLISELIKKAAEDVRGKNGKCRILDYGIGSGISLECLKSLNLDSQFKLTGTDISRESLEECTKKGIDTFDWYSSRNIKPKSYDVIISSFVFDFNITINEIKRLHYLLNCGGRLVLNLYKDDLINYNYVFNNLHKAGFSIRDENVIVSREKFGIGHKVEKVLIATKKA